MTLVRIPGSSRRASRSAAIDAWSSPQYPTGKHEAREQVGIGRARLRPFQEPCHRLRRSSQRLDLEMGVEVVRQAEVGVQLERPPKRCFRLAEIIADILDTWYLAITRKTRPNLAHAGA